MSLLVFGDSVDKPPGFINCIKSSYAWLDCSGVCKLPTFSGKTIYFSRIYGLDDKLPKFFAINDVHAPLHVPEAIEQKCGKPEVLTIGKIASAYNVMHNNPPKRIVISSFIWDLAQLRRTRNMDHNDETVLCNNKWFQRWKKNLEFTVEFTKKLFPTSELMFRSSTRCLMFHWEECHEHMDFFLYQYALRNNILYVNIKDIYEKKNISFVYNDPIHYADVDNVLYNEYLKGI